MNPNKKQQQLQAMQNGMPKVIGIIASLNGKATEIPQWRLMKTASTFLSKIADLHHLEDETELLALQLEYYDIVLKVETAKFAVTQRKLASQARQLILKSCRDLEPNRSRAVIRPSYIGLYTPKFVKVEVEKEAYMLHFLPKQVIVYKYGLESKP